MFDLNKLGDLSKMAGEAKQMQEKQERIQREQIDLLKSIAAKLYEVIKLLKQTG
jgi:hypothetical protein